MSLRTRLVLGVIALTLVGLVAADVATYSSLQSFLFDRTDASLAQAEQALARRHGGPPDDAVRGYYVEVRGPQGTVLTSGFGERFPGEQAPPPPALPAALDAGRTFTANASSGGGRYRVRTWLAGGATIALAAPLADVDATLHRLLLIELLVTALVLAGLAALGLYVVRLGLRPRGAIEETAAKIAAGDLGRRVEVTSERTEVGRLGLALNAMLAQIETAFRGKEASERQLRRFVADASHELRTPLAAVRAYAELFTRGASTRPDDLARSMHGIERESQRMSLLVDDLLLLARLVEGRPLEQAPVELDDVVREAVDAAKAVEPQRPIETSLEGAVVTGDRDRLRQIVDNLLSNARSHTPPGTPVHVSVAAPNGKAILTVRDEGPGLDQEHAAHVFERFYRSDASRTRASGGVGLGLAIVAAVAAAHGGAASASAEPGKGATMSIELPLAPA
jgi:two-component system OmpR family sensor kinase